MGPDAMILVFWMLIFKPTLSLPSFTFIKRLFSCSSLSAIRVVSSAYLRLLIFLSAFLIPACASSSPAFLMMYSAYKLNKQGDNMQPWRTLFPIWNQSKKDVNLRNSCHIHRIGRNPLSWSFRSLFSHCWCHHCHSCCLWIASEWGLREREKTKRIFLRFWGPLDCFSDRKREDFSWSHFCLHLLCSSELGLLWSLDWVILGEIKPGTSLLG